MKILPVEATWEEEEFGTRAGAGRGRAGVGAVCARTGHARVRAEKFSVAALTIPASLGLANKVEAAAVFCCLRCLG